MTECRAKNSKPNTLSSRFLVGGQPRRVVLNCPPLPELQMASCSASAALDNFPDNGGT